MICPLFPSRAIATVSTQKLRAPIQWSSNSNTSALQPVARNQQQQQHSFNH